MMRGLYITNWNLDDSASGVAKKIKSQIKLFETKLGEMQVYDGNSFKMTSSQKKLNKFLDFIRLSGVHKVNLMYRNLLKTPKLFESIDYIYIRKALITPTIVSVLRDIKQNHPNIKILMEIPTYPYDKEIRWFDAVSLMLDKKARKSVSEIIDRIVTFSDDKCIFGVPTIQISNGINYDAIKMRTPLTHEGINLIAVALFSPWHGYDRIIEGMHIERDVVEENNIVLHLIGNGRILNKYKSMVNENHLGDHVIFHGPEYGEVLDNSYNVADIALDAMGRHRSGVFYNSSLKGKEYCAKGIPSISGVKTELDFNNDAYFYCRVPADDTPVSMKKIIDFYHAVYDKASPLSVGEDIRNRTKSQFDFSAAMRPIIDYLHEAE